MCGRDAIFTCSLGGVCLQYPCVFQAVCPTSPVTPSWTAPSWWHTTSSRSSSWSTAWWQARTSASPPGRGSFEPFPCFPPTDNMPCHFTAAFVAGFCTTLVASPVDVVKTRYMNSVPGQYAGALSCALNMLLNEGPTSFYKGYKAWAKNKWHVAFFIICLALFSYLFLSFVDLCRHIFVWGPGTSWCLWCMSRFRGLWWHCGDDRGFLCRCF